MQEIICPSSPIMAYPEIEATKLLRFVICGSVDDGKSTLIGRLLYDAELIYDDHLTTLALDSKKQGTNEGYDFSLLVDGLIAEREQKITIDVAYRFFTTKKRAFIVADAPGHTQYTKNMATAASTADVAVILVDASKGILTQTRRHSMIAALFGIRDVLFVVNKMDLVHHSQARFDTLCDEYVNYAQSLGISKIHSIPVSALNGDNILHPSPKTPWYQGLSLIKYLENICLIPKENEQPFRMSVQWVNRPNADFRGFSGQITSGAIAPGDKIKVLPSGEQTYVDRIVTYDGDLDHAKTGQSITLTLKDEIDVSRGNVLVCADQPCAVADQLKADLIWMVDKPMVVGRQYSMKIGTTYALCTLSKPEYVIDTDSLKRGDSHQLSHNQIGHCSLLLDRLVAYELYEKNRALGCFIITDKITHDVLAAGVIREGTERTRYIPLQILSINQHMRSLIKSQKPLVLWFTGLSGAGKSTIANLLEKKLHAQGHHTMLLDANNLRHGLNNDLGFSEKDRIENTRRIAEVAKLMTDAGLITLVACIAPFENERMVARELVGNEQYIEIFVDAPLDVVEKRDVRGLYAKARSGEIANFTGVSTAYEIPQSPDLHIRTVNSTPEEAVQTISNWLKLNR